MSHGPTTPSAFDVLERVLDKGIVIDASVRLNVVGIDLATVDARVVVASLETYLKYATTSVNRAAHGAVSDGPGRADHDGARSVQIVRQAFEALNGHDLERYAALLDDGYVSETHGAPTTVQGRAAGTHAMDIYFKVLPDFCFVIESAVAAHHDVLVSWLATGTPHDASSGTSLMNRPLQIPGCTVTRLRHGKIVHAWNYWDTPTRQE